MSDHHSTSPSGAESWMTCFGYVNANKGLVEERGANPASSQGTAAHEVREICLNLGLDPHHLMGMKVEADGHVFPVDEELCNNLQPGIDLVRDIPGKMVVEHRVNLNRWIPGGFGTLDTGVFSPYEIVINDLKYGEGVAVSPVENKQLMIYGAGFWENIAKHRTKAKRFRLIIDQPRNGAGGGEWVTDLDYILDFMEEVKDAVEKTKDPDAPRVASVKGCMFCKRRKAPGGCYEYDRANLESIQMDFEDLDQMIEEESYGIAPRMPTTPPALTPERRAFIIRNAPMFSSWLKGVHALSLQAALHGSPDPGLKVVEGDKGNRKWIDETKTRDFLLARDLDPEAIVTVKLKSPAQVEKLLVKAERADLKPLYAQAPGKPVLVQESDPKEAISVASEFDAYDEEYDEGEL